MGFQWPRDPGPGEPNQPADWHVSVPDAWIAPDFVGPWEYRPPPAPPTPAAIPTNPAAAAPMSLVPATPTAARLRATRLPSPPGMTEPPVYRDTIEAVPAAHGLARPSSTLTQQMRGVRPPDVARQALGELSQLARKLDDLPRTMAVAGLVRADGAAYFAATRDYLGLCHSAWEAVAEERLEEDGAAADYREHAIAVARTVTHLGDESDRTPVGSVAWPARTPTPLWRRRVRLLRAGLRTWEGHLGSVPDPLAMGRGLFALRGYAGLALAGGPELVLLDFLLAAGLALTGLLTLGAALLLAAVAFAGGAVAAYAALALTCAIGFVLLILLSGGPLPLGPLLGASIFAPGRGPGLGGRGAVATAALLRAWWVVIGALAALAVPLALTVGGALLASAGPLPAITSPLAALDVVGSVLFITLALPASACLVGLLLLALPFALTSLARFAAELSGNRAWVPAARRYALAPALAVTLFGTALALAIVWSLGAGSAWGRVPLAVLAVAGAPATLTTLGLAIALAVALPYLLLLDLPFRLGIRNWRASHVDLLARRRAALESEVRRLATQEADDDILRAMQYDLVLLQFYRGQLDETRTTKTRPYRFPGWLLVLIIAIVTGLLADGMGDLLPRLLAGGR